MKVPTKQKSLDERWEMELKLIDKLRALSNPINEAKHIKRGVKHYGKCDFRNNIFPIYILRDNLYKYFTINAYGKRRH